MFNFPIGILLDSFRCDLPQAMRKAKALGADGFQVNAHSGGMAPENLSAAKRKEFLDIAKSNGLRISALCGDLGKGFGCTDSNPALVEKSKRILDLAGDLETGVITTHIGVVPGDSAHPRYAIMQEACAQLAAYADAHGAHFAVETGPETAATLKAFLDSLGSRGVAVNMDPANLVMVTGDDPVRAVYTLRDYIVHTHAKDGRKLLDVVDPEVIYGERDIEEVIQEGAAFEELPLGQGDVDWTGYLRALDEIGYKGFLTIEREVGADPEADIGMAVRFLRERIGSAK